MRHLILLVGMLAAALAFGASPLRPDAKLTPGVTRTAKLSRLCPHADTKAVRNVPESEKREVFARYGIAWSAHSNFEVDHLISLELGGANDIGNLWPQSYVTKPWNAHEKDRLEDHLHALVCKKQVTLEEAQRALRTDWIAAYGKYFGVQASARARP